MHSVSREIFELQKLPKKAMVKNIGKKNPAFLKTVESQQLLQTQMCYLRAVSPDLFRGLLPIMPYPVSYLFQIEAYFCSFIRFFRNEHTWYPFKG
jgi:hypothetical protein